MKKKIWTKIPKNGHCGRSENFLMAFRQSFNSYFFCFYEFPDGFLLKNQLYWHFLYCFDRNEKKIIFGKKKRKVPVK